MKTLAHDFIRPENSIRKKGIPVPEFFNFAYDVIDKRAETDRNKLAMIWANQEGQERKLTFHDFSKRSNQAANLLFKFGISQGDRVFLLLPRIPEWWIFSLAIMKLGAVQCSVPMLCTTEDIQKRLQYGKFKAVITDVDSMEKFDGIRAECPTVELYLTVDGSKENWVSYPQEIKDRALSKRKVKTPHEIRTKATDPLLLSFTSGTSSFPKLVQHIHAYPLGHRVTAEMWHGLTPQDLHWSVTDVGWAKNLWGNYFGQWIAGATLFVYDIRGKFHPDEILPILEKYEITSFCAPPTIYRMIVINDLTRFDFSELRKCTSAGEPLHTDTIRLWKEGTGLTIREGYGQTETVCMIGNFIDIKQKPGSIGKAAPGWEIELHDDDGFPVKTGEPGRIAVNIRNGHPVGLVEKYLNNENDNRESFINGFYYTGDKAWQDEEGYFYFVGRSDDIIKSAGYRVGPMEVEEILMKHPAVREVAVVGAPDLIRGTKIKAYVALNPGFEVSEKQAHDIQEFFKLHSAPYKYPREIEFVQDFPKTISGKIKRDLLRKHAETGEKWA